MTMSIIDLKQQVLRWLLLSAKAKAGRSDRACDVPSPKSLPTDVHGVVSRGG